MEHENEESADGIPEDMLNVSEELDDEHLRLMSQTSELAVAPSESRAETR